MSLSETKSALFQILYLPFLFLLYTNKFSIHSYIGHTHTCMCVHAHAHTHTQIAIKIEWVMRAHVMSVEDKAANIICRGLLEACESKWCQRFIDCVSKINLKNGYFKMNEKISISKWKRRLWLIQLSWWDKTTSEQ